MWPTRNCKLGLCDSRNYDSAATQPAIRLLHSITTTRWKSETRLSLQTRWSLAQRARECSSQYAKLLQSLLILHNREKTYVSKTSCRREAATICPRPCDVDLWPLTLKVLSESPVTWATSVPILVFLRDSLTDRRHMSDVRRASSLKAPAPGPRLGAGHNKKMYYYLTYTANTLSSLDRYSHVCRLYVQMNTGLPRVRQLKDCFRWEDAFFTAAS